MAMQIGTALDSINFTRSMQYFSICEKYGNMFGVDPYIMVAKMAQESGGNPTVNADGLMQIISFNGVWERTVSAKTVAGDTVSFTISKAGRQNPDDAIKWATMYVASLKRSVGDDMKATLAYNLGPGTVLWIKKRYPSAWDNGLEWTNYIKQARDAVLGTGGDPLYLEHVMRYYAGSQYGEGDVQDPPAFPVLEGTPMTSPYGYRTHPITGDYTFHAGTDYGGDAGDPIFATQTGTVMAVGWHDIMGWYISLDHTDDEYYSRYQHLSEKPTLSIGAEVIRGQEVGKMGTTGSSTGVHLHFVIGLNNSGSWNEEASTMDPEKYLAMATAQYVAPSNSSTVNENGTIKTPTDPSWGKNGTIKFEWAGEGHDQGLIRDEYGRIKEEFYIINNVTGIGTESWRPMVSTRDYMNGKKYTAINSAGGILNMWQDGHYFLTNDIDMHDTNIYPIPFFKGTIKTNGFVIYNMRGTLIDVLESADIGISHGSTDATFSEFTVYNENHEMLDPDYSKERDEGAYFLVAGRFYRYESDLDWTPYQERWNNDGGDGGDGETLIPVYVLDNETWVKAKEVYVLNGGNWTKAKEVKGLSS